VSIFVYSFHHSHERIIDRISHINMKILCLSPLLARLNYIQIRKLAVLVTSQEIYDIINPTGVFCNLEHVASPSVELHVRFLNAIGYSPEKEDRANRLLPMEIQLGWLRDTGFVEVDCYWKWLEMALLIGYKA
jgi:hypothetical protein